MKKRTLRSIPEKKISALVFDYDGTLTLENGVFPDSTKKALHDIFDLKLAILGIVSGRDVAFLKQVDKSADNPFSFLVAENGAVTYFSKDEQTLIIGKDWTQKARVAFENVDFYVRFFEIICSSKCENTDKIIEVLKESGLEAKLIPNKDSIMVCPPNVDKGKGVAQAIEHFGHTSEILVTCFGDGENDLALFGPADVRVAVSNAVTPLKKIADVITSKEGGLGVEEYLRKSVLHKNAARYS